jgi:predicted acylesterase/phospholipase RssA
MPKTHVLSIDGGGIRGIIPAFLLELFENELPDDSPKSRIAEHFHVFAGTSTGAIIAAGLAADVEISTIRALYRNECRTIFPSTSRSIREWGSTSWWKKPIAAVGSFFVGLGHKFESVLKPTYSSVGLMSVLEVAFKSKDDPQKDLTLADIPEGRRLLVPAFNATTRRYMFFDSQNPDHHSFKLANVCQASASAPTYFPAHNEEIKGVKHVLLDGGVMANNPAALAVTALMQAQVNTDDILLVTLGTGQFLSNTDADQGQGALGWLWDGRVFDVFFDGNAAVADDILHKVLPPANIFRFQLELRESLMAMDDVSNVSDLEIRTSQYWDDPETKQEFRDALSALTGTSPTRINLNGLWKSTFTWIDPVSKKLESSTDTVTILQAGLVIEGSVTEGDYRYKFIGRVEENDIIGEWNGLEHDLNGPFMLRFKRETGNQLVGYWIGKGDSGLYNGEWTLSRVEAGHE